MSAIHSALLNLFNKHRIVFWYDDKEELHSEFESFLRPGIETIELANNEFAVKYRLLRKQPEQKFLIYHAGPAPEDPDNWLLDVQLGQGEFRADRVGLWLNELELSQEHAGLLQEHRAFFAVESRRGKLKAILNSTDKDETIRRKMLAVCADSESDSDLREILKNLLSETAQDEHGRFDLISRCGLAPFLWNALGHAYQYYSDVPGMLDFTIELFKSCYALGLCQKAKLNSDALVFLKLWKDSRTHSESFERLSGLAAETLGIEQDLQRQDYRALLEMDLFEFIDWKIINELVHGVANRTLSAAACSQFIRERRSSHWFARFEHVYKAIDYASQLISGLDRIDLAIDSLEAGVQRYSQYWYRIDRLYRKMIFHLQACKEVTILESMVSLAENLYSNHFLLQVNNNWQRMLDPSSQWDAGAFPLQNSFFAGQVKKTFLDNRKKIFVIISDALRYEVASELLEQIRREDRYQAELTPMVSMLPSYTQLGMAALLPNRELAFAENTSGAVLVDGISSQGTANRDKILKLNVPSAEAIKADEFLAMNRDAARELVRDHDMVYIYHNRIDATGDKKETEDQVFEAVEEALKELLMLIKKLAAANATNILITSDHGFLYQNKPIDESDFSISEVSGETVFFSDRRFILGKRLPPQPSLKHYFSSAAGLAGEIEIQIPKSISRLRLKGSGSRYVHGGATLQEVVIPVLLVNKKRESDIRPVNVEILRSGSSLITSGQLSVTFYQSEPVSEKVSPRKLIAGIYTESGALISDRHERIFDFRSENEREREVPIRFLLTREADKANNQEVILRLSEQEADTTHYKEYKSQRFTIRRTFTSDFDL